jgi:prevent-host-death family protein
VDWRFKENNAASLLRELAEIAIMDRICAGARAMKIMSAKDAKNAFGMLIDNARAQPVTIEKHGRPVVVVLSVEEYERLKTHELLVAPSENEVKRKK